MSYRAVLRVCSASLFGLSNLKLSQLGVKIMVEEAEYTVDEVLLPLAITIIIDKKVRKPEMNSFFRQAEGLLDLFSLPAMSENQLRGWFKRNAEELEGKLKGARRNTIILRAVSRFKKQRDAEAVYDAMVSISVSDKEYVKAESELIKSAAVIWGFPRPPIKVDK